MNAITPPAVTLSEGQQNAYNRYASFIAKPDPGILVIAGYAGTGKSTLVERLLSDTEKMLKTGALLTQAPKQWEMQLAATTHKAAEALTEITQCPVATIQSVLKLVVDKNYSTNKTELIPRYDCVNLVSTILFIDEASFIDQNLLDLIVKLTKECKVIFIGDPAQLTPVKSKTTPVFTQGFDTVSLEDVVRQAKDNPIIELATNFRNVVNGEPFFQFTPDNHHIVRLPRGDFQRKIVEDLSAPGWTYNTSKVLAWRNKVVEEYNFDIREHVQGDPELGVGDYALVNEYVNIGRTSLKSNQLVKITSITPEQSYGVDGWSVGINNTIHAFLPKNIGARASLEKQLKKQGRIQDLKNIATHWVDLRAAYACTINKSQGSTYDSVFIDLDDVGRCKDGIQIARLLYVAVSRARHHVYMTGDLV